MKEFSKRYLFFIALLFTGIGAIGYIISKNTSILILYQLGLIIACLIPCGIVMLILLLVKLIFHMTS